MGKGRGKTTNKTGKGRKAKKEPDYAEECCAVADKTKPAVKYRYPVPGLTNLGNTCFFNAVLQNISQSCHFRTQLFHLLGMKMYQLELKLPQSEVSRNLSVTTPHGPLTKALGQLLEQMGTPSSGTVHPGVVFSEVCKQAPRFKGHDQQDSQELLRYLLDSLRTEEINRRKRAILLSFNVNSKPSNDALTENDRRDIKAYGHQAGMAPTFVDEVFAGKLMSSVECSSCHYRSAIHEDFMDLCLSIPVNEAVSNPSYMTRSKNQKKEAETSKKTSEPTAPVEKAAVSKSKYQQKKDRQQQHKTGKGKSKPSRQHAGTSKSSMATEGADQKLENQIDTVAIATSQENVTCGAGPEDSPPSTSDEAGSASHPTGDTSSPNSVGDTASPNPIEDTARSNPIGDVGSPNLLRNTASSDVVVEDTAVHCIADSSALLSEHHKEEDKVVEKLASMGLSSAPDVPSGAPDCTNGMEQPSAENGAPSDDHTLLACLRRFCSLELLAGDNKLACPGCYTRSKDSSHPHSVEPPSSGPGHPDPLSSGPDPPSNTPNNPDSLGSGPDPLSNTPNHSDPLSSGPDPPSNTPNHPDPLSSGPDPPSNTPNHSDPLGSGPDPPSNTPNLPDSLGSGIDRFSSQQSSVYMCDHSETPVSSIPASNPIATVDATVTTCAVIPSTLMSGGDSRFDALPVEGTGEENVLVDEEDDWKEEGSPGQSPQGGNQMRDTLTHKRGQLQDSATLGSEDGEEDGDHLLSMETSVISLDKNKEASAKEKDVVYSDLATKQMLVARPPLVLVLCLKRFIHQGKSVRKNNAFISFPLLLDLTPFCTQSCQSQYGRIQYSLYGLVEHAGGMHGGHYVAYVNARQPESGHPIAMETNSSQQSDSTDVPCVSGHPALLQRTGDWYYMSDTHVRPASEGEVLKAQAYLLFYERIL